MYYSILKMEVKVSSEILAIVYKTTRRQIPEDSNNYSGPSVIRIPGWSETFWTNYSLGDLINCRASFYAVTKRGMPTEPRLLSPWFATIVLCL
jgi:hypothetical protein